jgi:hypothetical protein
VKTIFNTNNFHLIGKVNIAIEAFAQRDEHSKDKAKNDEKAEFIANK